MLGWEFPPFINGGLGVASLGLGKAIAEHTDLTIIIPRTDPEYLLDKAQLIGLNDITVESWTHLEREAYDSIIEKAELEYIRSNLSPYETSQTVFFSWEEKPGSVEKEFSLPAAESYVDVESQGKSEIYHQEDNHHHENTFESHPGYSEHYHEEHSGDHVQEGAYIHTPSNIHHHSSAEPVPTQDSHLDDLSASFSEHAEIVNYHIQQQISADIRKESLDTDPFELVQGKSKNMLDIKELYGGDVIQHVIDYGKFASEIALEKHFDIIHAHDWMTFLAGLELKGLTGKPLALHIHSLEYDRSGPYVRNWVYYLEKYAMEKADLIIPVSEYSADIIETYYEINRSKIAPVHNGLDIPEVKRVKKPFPEHLVIFLGRITEQKGPQFFLQMALRILKQRQDVRFVMAGQGNLLPQLIQKVAEHRIGDKFHFTGFLQTNKVRELLGMADVFVMPSVSEPFGLAAVEAAHSGVPCVISNQSGAAEVLKGALKANYWDSDKLARHVNMLLDSPDVREEVVEEMQEHLKVSWDDAAQKVLHAYEMILSNE